MDIYFEEVFGPVAALFTVDRPRRGHRDRATATRTGSASNLWSEDEDERARFIRDIASGMAFVNGMVTSYPELPFGGVKQSGYGRELTEVGMREFMNAKTVWIGAPSSEHGGGAHRRAPPRSEPGPGGAATRPRPAPTGQASAAACRVDQCRWARQSAGTRSARAGSRLVERVVLRWRELRPVDRPLRGEVPEPRLAGLEAAHDRMAGVGGVRPRVPVRRGVAAADVPALGAAAQVEPPAAGGLALHAAGAAGRHGDVDP